MAVQCLHRHPIASNGVPMAPIKSSPAAVSVTLLLVRFSIGPVSVEPDGLPRREALTGGDRLQTGSKPAGPRHRSVARGVARKPGSVDTVLRI